MQRNTSFIFNATNSGKSSRRNCIVTSLSLWYIPLIEMKKDHVSSISIPRKQGNWTLKPYLKQSKFNFKIPFRDSCIKQNSSTFRGEIGLDIEKWLENKLYHLLTKQESKNEGGRDKTEAGRMAATRNFF